MKLPTLILSSLLFIPVTVNSDIVNNYIDRHLIDTNENEAILINDEQLQKFPALIEFKMVLYKGFRNPRMVLSIDPESYKSLGSPGDAIFELAAWGYRANTPKPNYSHLYESVNVSFVKDNKIDKYVAKLNYEFKGGVFDDDSGVSFQLNSVCLHQKNSNPDICVDTNLFACCLGLDFVKEVLWFIREPGTSAAL